MSDDLTRIADMIDFVVEEIGPLYGLNECCRVSDCGGPLGLDYNIPGYCQGLRDKLGP